MKKLIIIFLTSAFYIQHCFAVTGQITVLESPLFSQPDETSKILQYKRKGAEIYIHKQEVIQDEFEDLSFNNPKGIKADKNKDLFIGDEKLYYPELDGKFFKTLTSNGQEAFVLKEHVFLILKDKRELSQKIIEHDHTDYRISEPLPKDYPFYSEEGYRGVSIFAFGIPNYSPYNYTEKVIDTEFSTSKEISFIWSRAEDVDYRKRFFFGLMTGLHHSSINFLTTNFKSTQENMRFFLGPLAGYDIYRTKENALNIYTSTQFYLYDKMKITIEDNNSEASEERSYQSNLGISQVFGANYQFFKIIHEFDVVLGLNGRINLPRTYTAESSAGNQEFWKSTGSNDSYSQDLTTELSLYFAFQSYY